MRSIQYKGRNYTLQGLQPYTRQDGSETSVASWAGTCQHPGCGRTFTFITPANATPSTSKSFFRVHCESHVLTPGEALAKARAAKDAKAKKAESDTYDFL